MDGSKVKMVKVKPNEEHEYYMDGYKKANLDHAINEVRRKNYDLFTLYVAREGHGKSTMAMQDAMYCDPTFNLSRVCFTPEQFLETIDRAEKHQAIVFDETMWAMGSRNVLGRMNKILVKVMSEMRSKNLFVFMCIPNFFMMDWYVAQHRSTGMIYIYKRGFFGSYDYITKKKLYIAGKKFHSYGTPPNFRGRFTKYFPLDIEAYEKKKQEAINSFVEGTKTESLWKQQRDIMIRECLSQNLMKRKEISEILGLSTRQVGRISDMTSPGAL